MGVDRSAVVGWGWAAVLLGLAACAMKPPVSAYTPEETGPEPGDAMVRHDLRCPSGEIVYTGGLGGDGRVWVRELEACGRSATYVWKDSRWTRKRD